MTGGKLITTPQIDEQLHVSTPKRAVIVHRGLIEEAEEAEGAVQEEVMPCFHSAKCITERKRNSLKTEEAQFPSRKRIIEIHMDLNVYTSSNPHLKCM